MGICGTGANKEWILGFSDGHCIMVFGNMVGGKLVRGMGGVEFAGFGSDSGECLTTFNIEREQLNNVLANKLADK